MATPKKKSKSTEPQRTQSIPVQPVTENKASTRGEVFADREAYKKQSFELSIGPAKAPNEVIPPKSDEKLSTVDQKQPSAFSPKVSPKNHKLQNKVWGTLEWLATSALIFLVLFFVINYSSYSTIFIDKLDQIRGTVQTSPFIQKLANTDSTPVEQEPLPLPTTNTKQEEVPYLNLEIAPPDDRIIIPRIKKNVPIVKVNSENLLKRDWGALEKDIQGALQGGVVHYPGTAEPGENGNAVITGHSSYFPWDPGNFKDVFALLHEVAIGDIVVVYHDQKKYLYKVYERKVVAPDQVDVLTQDAEKRLTLITCTPIGTNLKRLIVLAHPA